MSTEPDNELQERTPAGDAPQSAAPGRTGAGDAAEPFEPIDRIEFRRGLNDIHRGILETDAMGTTARKVDELRQLAGWTMLTVGIYIALIGFVVMVGPNKGKRS